jgi:hypothetical protein
MKSIFGAMLFFAAMAGCAVEGEPETNPARLDERGAHAATDVTDVTVAMPAEAAKAMQAAKTLGLAPLFYACPPRLTVQPIAADASGNDVMTDWIAMRSTAYSLDKPKLGGNPMRWVAMCGTTQSADPWASLRKILPAGYSTCTTSAVGVVPAWLVCT